MARPQAGHRAEGDQEALLFMLQITVGVAVWVLSPRSRDSSGVSHTDTRHAVQHRMEPTRPQRCAIASTSARGSFVAVRHSR